jgi:hypothetical protein
MNRHDAGLRISDDDEHAFERLLTGGVWAQSRVACNFQPQASAAGQPSPRPWAK